MNTERLIENVTDQIKEAQLKLGYARETIRLYFPMESLNAILGTAYSDEEVMLADLRTEEAFKDCSLGMIRFFARQERFEVRIPPEGAEYVAFQVKEPAFLKALIELFANNHHLTIEEIEALFAAFSDDFVCEKMSEDTDFDYSLHFESGIPDSYFYCIKMEMGHTIYHRFTESDYRALLI